MTTRAEDRHTHAGSRRAARRFWWRRGLALLILPVLAVTYWALGSIERLVRADLASTLVTVVATSHNTLSTWARTTRAEAQLWAEQEWLRRFVESWLQGSGVEVDELRDGLAQVSERHAYLGAAVLSADGRSIADLPDKLTVSHLRAGSPDTIVDALAGQSRLGLPFTTGFARTPALMLVTAPIRGMDERILAALVFVLDPAQDFSQVTLGRLGETGETYAFDRRARLLTESRYEEQLRAVGLIEPGQHGILNLELRDPGGNLLEGYRPGTPRDELPLTRMARSAVQGEQGLDLDGYRDYRGVLVVGAWRWDQRLGVGLATEIDFAQAYAPLRAMRRLVLVIVAVLIAVAGVATAVLWQQTRALDKAVAGEQSARVELEASVGRLEAAQSELRQALESRDDFLSLASHELKTPLTSLRLNLDLLMRDLTRKEGGPARLIAQEPALKSSLRQVERLTKLAEGLLDVVRIQAGQLTLEPKEVDLAAIVRDVVDRHKAQLEESHSELRQEIAPAQGFWDPWRIDTVVSNLLANAIKYGRGRTITLAVWSDAERAFLRVADQGIGIPPEQQRRIFGRFMRAVPARSYSGLGLGLYISNQIVEAHGGSVSVDSRPDIGSTFTVTLPRAARKLEPPPPQ